MSEIDLEKDDKATQEMLAMMEESNDSLDEAGSLDADDLLEALNALPEDEVPISVPSATEEMTMMDIPDDLMVDDLTKDITSSKELESAISEDTDFDDPLNIDDLDALMAEANNEVETEVEIQDIEPVSDLPPPSPEEGEALDEIEALLDDAESALDAEETSTEVNMDDIDLSDLDIADLETPTTEAEPAIDDIDLDDLDIADLETPTEAEPAIDDIDLDDLDMVDLETPTESEPAIDDIELDDLDMPDLETPTEAEPAIDDVDLDDLNMTDLEASTKAEPAIDDVDLGGLAIADLETAAEADPAIGDIDLGDLEMSEMEMSSEEASAQDIELEDELATMDAIDENLPELSEDTETAETPIEEEQDLPDEMENIVAAEEIADSTAIMTSNEDDLALIEQTGASVSSMEQAIELDQSIQSIAKEVQQTAQEATLLAIETSKQAQASAERTQQAIEATFSAAERAFEAAKNAGYSVDLSSLENPPNPQELSLQLAEIQEKNRHLKTINESIKARIAELKAE